MEIFPDQLTEFVLESTSKRSNIFALRTENSPNIAINSIKQ